MNDSSSELLERPLELFEEDSVSDVDDSETASLRSKADFLWFEGTGGVDCLG